MVRSIGKLNRSNLLESSMFHSTLSRTAILSISMLLAACSTPGAQPAGSMEVRQGSVEQITATQLTSNHHTGVGAVIGGVAGLGVGSLIGGGTGRDVAMVLGTVGGAVAGNEVQKKYDKPVPGQQVVVRTTSGVLVTVTQPVSGNLRVGQRVYIEGNGENARVVPQ
jgi:outer membrane lipoprotein SlyB